MTTARDSRSREPNSESAALLGPSEPNWATQVRWRRLAGLLNLSCLLSEVTLITDTDLCENANFLQSFRAKRADGLYSRLRQLVEIGFVKILIRDEAYRPNLQIPIASFTDIYEAWLRQDPPDAWVLRDFSDERRKYYADLDSWAVSHTLTYSYRKVKDLYMQNLRAASAEYFVQTPFMSTIRALPANLQADYYDILDRPWFSLTTINQLFQRHGLTIDDRAMHFQGLLNQLAYSSYVDASLVGIDDEGVAQDNRDTPDKVTKKLATVSLDEILDRADALLDGPPLAILGLLSCDEVAHLRSLGRSYFALLALSRDHDFRASLRTETGNLFVSAATSYWAHVCDYVQTNYSPLTERRTRLGVFIGYDPTRVTLPKEVFSIAVEAGLGVASAGLPAVGKAVTKAAKTSINFVRLKFLFVTPTEDFKQIRRVLPRSFWFRRSHPDVLP